MEIKHAFMLNKKNGSAFAAVFVLTTYITSLAFKSTTTEAPVVRASTKQINIAVFGGSTTAGAGVVNKTDAWPLVFESILQSAVGRRVVVDNYARGATKADYFASCFQRFARKPYDFVLIELAVNGGDVSSLVQAAKATTKATVILVRLHSCRTVRPSQRARPSFHEEREHQRNAAYDHFVPELDFTSSLTKSFGSPCSREAQDKLFDANEVPTIENPGRHHLGVAGNRLLAEFVAGELAPILKHQRRQIDAMLPSSDVGRSESCYFDDSPLLSTASEAVTINGMFSLRQSFQGDGWEHKPASPGRLDKTCWESAVNASTLRTIRVVGFESLDVFVELSHRRKGVLQVLCGDVVVAIIDMGPDWALWSLSERVIVDKTCTNETLGFRMFEFRRSARPARICGVALHHRVVNKPARTSIANG